MRVTWPMVRHQGRLAARSVRDIARDPRRAHGLRRLVATRGRGTMRLALPWLPFPLIDLLSERIGPGSRVFEYGGGGSTLWFLGRGATVVTVEHHPAWADRLRDEVAGGPGWTLLQRSLADDASAYVNAIDQYDDDAFDLVVVDGRERARCALAALCKVRPGGWLVVDDSDRDRYAHAIDSIAAAGWARTDIAAFAPAKPTLAYSTLLRKPGVDG